MSDSKPTARKPKCSPCLITALGGMVLLAVVSARVATVVEKVFSGAGMEHCCTIEGVPFNYLAVFVLLCGVVAVLLFALVLQVREWRVRRDFERKYGVKVPASSRETAAYGDSTGGHSLHGYEHHDGD